MYSFKNVTCVTLLSKKEWEDIIRTVPNVPVEQDILWWLRDDDPRSEERAYCVDSETGMTYTYPKYDQIGVRPLFNISSYGSQLPSPGTKITIEGLICTVVDTEKALSDDCVLPRQFDSGRSSFENSELCEFLKSEAFEKTLSDYLPF